MSKNVKACSSATAEQLFPSEDEREGSVDRKTEKKRAGKSMPSLMGEPSSKKRKTTTINPVPAVEKSTARDLFGSDSDDEEFEETKKPGTAPIYNYFTRRLANGHSRQTNDDKTGSHYIELKVYKTSEIQSVLPMNRWRHAIVTVKNQLDTNSESWKCLDEFIKASKKDFKKCPPTFMSSYYNST
ncbi:hypothetical protein JYU34_006987 [Plutella xylostella]|uniref:Uncharacterized protein n=1 Tax=Plutella xylostella TaxID=51655 RepID=A0ABQ7QTD6_PLUXY|nr:hypothetical protein JYU34_006987 [Plutella xylostella]